MSILPDFLRRRGDETPVVEVGGRKVPIAIRRMGQARRMTMRLAPDGSEIRISMPKWGRTAEAVAFAKSRADWLAGQLARHAPPAPMGHGARIPFRGVVLGVEHVPTAPRRVSIVGAMLRVGGPAEGMDGRIRRWVQAQAKAAFADDLAFYCARAGVPIPTLTLTNARSRWGSCSSRGVIRLNWRLIMAPDHIRRSVVAHEVTHLVHFDHSPRFHAMLATLFEGDIDAANRWFKTQGRALYAVLG